MGGCCERFFAFVLAVGLLWAGTLVAAAESYEDALAKFAADSYNDTDAAIAGVGVSGNPLAVQVIEALQDGRLFFSTDKKVYWRDAEGALHDAASGSVASPEPTAINPVRVNNRLRRSIEAALGGLLLLSPDPAKRLEAAKAVFKSKDANARKTLERAIDKETERGIKRALLEARAAVVLAGREASVPERIEAIAAIRDRLGIEHLRPCPRGLSIAKLTGAFANFGFSVPLPAVDHVFSGFQFLSVILVTAIPFGIYDLVEAMDNVESAEAAGDAYPTTAVLTADGVVSLIGYMIGNPFINAVYIGHPGWKAMGGRLGYSATTGIMVILLSWFGIIAVLLALVPIVAISPILLYIGMLIGAQAFQTTPAKHAPAIVLALTPHLAAWCKTLMDGALGAAGTSAAAVGMEKLGQVGVLYHGLEVLGGGSILTGLILGAVGVFIIERKFRAAAAFAFTGAVLTYFGFMHGEAVGIGTQGLGVTPSVAIAYAIVGVFLMTLSRAPEMQMAEGATVAAAAAE